MADKSTYTLIHTAEQIDSKLNLVDENKNLLKYPYTYEENKPQNGLTDVGDGSILISGKITGETFVLNNTLSLLAGTYMLSVYVVNVTDTAVPLPGVSLKAEIGDSTYSTDSTGPSIYRPYESFRLDTETTVSVSLCIPGTEEATGLIIKPQLEKCTDGQTEPSDWVPNMDKIGTYVDRRFNGTNAKIKVLTDTKAEKEHSHNYAGSASAGGAANKVATALTIELDGGETEDTDKFIFDGSAAKVINITPEKIGAMRHGDSAPPTEHGHVSSEITMTNYTRANAISAIETTDSLNVAIGKLEKILEDFISSEIKRNKLLDLLACIETIEL